MGSPVKLPPAAYWEIRARIRDVEAVEYELLQQRLAGQRRLADAKAAVNACLDRWGVPDTSFNWNDDTQELTPV